MRPIPSSHTNCVIENQGHSNEYVGNFSTGLRSPTIPGDAFMASEDSGVPGAGQRRRETCTLIRTLAHYKKMLRVGYWNARTMYSTGMVAHICREVGRYLYFLEGARFRPNSPPGEKALTKLSWVRGRR